ncbi:MAG: tRNA pseudouridine(13) synthase TruD [Syntrophobacteria bacterium]
MYLTEDLPGTGGRIKERPEDFLVEEIPLYEFSGAGGFTFLLVETTNLSTLDLVARLRRNLDLADHQVGLAGWKDKHAVTRQWISVPRDHVCSARLRQLGTDGIKILEERHHPHKLRTGHLLGNRFSIMIRNPEPGAEEKARGIIRRIRTDGLPNFYGRQRFGAAGDNPETGRGLLLGTRRVRSVRKRKLFISAFASLVFNFTLKERMERGLFTRLLQGDIAKKHPTGGLFRVSSPAAEQKRADCLEISATGPVWGKKMMQPGDEARDLEEDVLRRQGLTGDVFRKQPGSRRSLRVPLEEISLHQEPSGLRLEFYLPKGAYATVLLDEIMKTSSF